MSITSKSVASSDDFSKRMNLLARPAEQFRPTATYDRDGDCIEFLAKPDVFYAEPLDDMLTLYFSQETDELIGCLIDGVAKFCRRTRARLPGFPAEFCEGHVCLQHLLLARLWSEDLDEQSVAALTYRKLIDATREMTVEICSAC